MSFNISDIRCPQCGDKSKSSRGDHFKCGNCRTEYYIDNTGATTNIADAKKLPSQRPAYAQAPPPPPNVGTSYSETTSTYNRREKKKGKSIFFYLIIPVFLLLIGLFVFGFYKFYKFIDDKPLYYNSASVGSYSVTHQLTFPITIDDELYVFTLGNRSYRSASYSYDKNDERNGIYYSFVDVVNEEEVHSEKITSLDRLDDVSHRLFSNGKHYIIINNERVFEVALDELDLVDVSDEVFKDKSNPDIAPGIAKVEFTCSHYLEGFKVVNNEGKEFSYNPWITGDYPQNKGDYMTVIMPKDSTYYAFSKKSSIFDVDLPKNEEVQFLKIKSKYIGCELEQPEWRGRKNWKQNNRPEDEPALFRKRNMPETFNNLTPGAFYFNPKVVYYDNNGRLLIKTNESPNEKSKQLLKCLDSENGDEIWTIELENNERYNHFFNPENCVFADGQYLIKTEVNEYMIISEDGTEIEEYELSMNVD